MPSVIEDVLFAEKKGKAGDEQPTHAHPEHAAETIFLSSVLSVRDVSRRSITTTRDVCERACMKQKTQQDQSVSLYTTIGDGNYATIVLEEQREHKNDRDCIRKEVVEQHEAVRSERKTKQKSIRFSWQNPHTNLKDG